jgi:maleate isomerase
MVVGVDEPRELRSPDVSDGLLRLGVLTPHVASGPEAEFPAMAPGWITTQVVRVSGQAADDVAPGPPTPLAAAALTAPPLLDDAARSLAAGSIDAIGYASTSTGYALGFTDEAALVQRLCRRAGIPVAATCGSAVLALQVLEVDRIAIVHPPWFNDELNELGAAYFRGQGLHVLSSASATLSRDPRRIEAAAVDEWTARQVSDDAQAVFIGGNGFRAAAAIEALEAALERPVLTASQVLLWSLLGLAGATLEIGGYGRLFARTSTGDVQLSTEVGPRP